MSRATTHPDKFGNGIAGRPGPDLDVDCAVGNTLCLRAGYSGYEIDEAEVSYWDRCPECVAATSVSSGRRGARWTTHQHPRTQTPSIVKWKALG